MSDQEYFPHEKINESSRPVSPHASAPHKGNKGRPAHQVLPKISAPGAPKKGHTHRPGMQGPAEDAAPHALPQRPHFSTSRGDRPSRGRTFKDIKPEGGRRNDLPWRAVGFSALALLALAGAAFWLMHRRSNNAVEIAAPSPAASAALAAPAGAVIPVIPTVTPTPSNEQKVETADKRIESPGETGPSMARDLPREGGLKLGNLSGHAQKVVGERPKEPSARKSEGKTKAHAEHKASTHVKHAIAPAGSSKHSASGEESSVSAKEAKSPPAAKTAAKGKHATALAASKEAKSKTGSTKTATTGKSASTKTAKASASTSKVASAKSAKTKTASTKGAKAKASTKKAKTPPMPVEEQVIDTTADETSAAPAAKTHKAAQAPADGKFVPLSKANSVKADKPADIPSVQLPAELASPASGKAEGGEEPHPNPNVEREDSPGTSQNDIVDPSERQSAPESTFGGQSTGSPDKPAGLEPALPREPLIESNAPYAGPRQIFKGVTHGEPHASYWMDESQENDRGEGDRVAYGEARREDDRDRDSRDDEGDRENGRDQDGGKSREASRATGPAEDRFRDGNESRYRASHAPDNRPDNRETDGAIRQEQPAERPTANMRDDYKPV